MLSVRGRKTGEWHSTPVNPLTFSGQRYLVAPRGETQWVRNVRVSREARLTLGGSTETVRRRGDRRQREAAYPARLSQGVGVGGEAVLRWRRVRRVRG